MDKQEQAIQFIKEKDYEQAAKLFIEHIDEHPNDSVGYINFGNLLEMMNQHEEAERFFLKAIELDEKAATAFVGLGNLYYKRKLFAEAEKMLRHALHLGIEDSEVYYLLGLVHLQKEEKMLAIPFLQRASELSDDIEKKFQYGLALAQANYADEAEKVLKEVVLKENSHADALYNLGIIMVHRDNLDEALYYFNQALAQDPGHKMAEDAKRNVLNMNER